MNIKLYDYQKIAYKKVLSALLETAKALMVMATGLGKTIVSAKIVEYFLSKKPKARILFLCHDTGILERSLKKYEELLGDKYTYARFFGENKNWNADEHTFVFATFQSKPHEFFKAKHFDYIIVDEGHHAKADTYEIVLNFFKPIWKLGMTATPDREDERDIRHMFGKEVVNYSLPEALAKGWLTPLEYKIVTDGLDQDELELICQEVFVEKARISEKQINERIFIQKRSEKQCLEILQHTSGGEKAIVFCRNITHLRHLAEILPNSVWLHSEQSSKENEDAMDAFENGDASHVLVVDKFNEGIHVPNVEVLAFLRSTDSYRIWLQQLGRALSKVAGKFKVTVLDFVANIERVKNVQKLITEIEEFNPVGMSQNEQLILGTPLHVDGKGFSFDFSSEIVNVLSVLEYMVSSNEFYDTWQEASEVSINAGIVDVADYQKRHKQVNRKLPFNPGAYYSDFPGWLKFLKKEVLPKGWQTHSQTYKKLRASPELVEKFVNEIQKKQPDWVKNYWNSTGIKITKCYHPKLLKLLREKFLVYGLPPEGYKNASFLAEENKLARETIYKFVEKFRKDHSEWFGIYHPQGNGKPSEHFHPQLCLRIVEFSKNYKILDGWISFGAIESKLKGVSRHTIKAFANVQILKHKELYRKIGTGEYYHPDLAKIIVDNFKSLDFPPDGWTTVNKLYVEEKISSDATIKRYISKYREKHPEWFVNYRTMTAPAEFLHPDLVALIRKDLGGKSLAPSGWFTATGLKQMKIASVDAIINFVKKRKSEFPIEFFNEFYVKGCLREHYHPDLVQKIKEHFGKK
ncbi:MAG: DEAD/DEAH box helicase [bacterium]